MAIFEENYTKKLIYDENGNVTHMGEALPGIATSTPGWRIRKFTIDAAANGDTIVTDEQWAGGDLSFNKVMDDYASYAYA